jgi:hypothetical protein
VARRGAGTNDRRGGTPHEAASRPRRRDFGRTARPAGLRRPGHHPHRLDHRRARGAEGAKAGHKDCAEKCVGKGYKLVFYDQSEKKIYKLDDQATAKSHLGYEVKVTGTVEGDALKVEKIEKAAA